MQPIHRDDVGEKRRFGWDAGSPSVNYNSWGFGATNPIPSGFAFRFPMPQDLCIQDSFIS
jgi:hypothetical protein